MEKKDRVYNAITKRCYKSGEQKKKHTNPVTKKCRKRCKSNKFRRAEDDRYVKKTSKIYKKRGGLKTPTPKASTPKASTPKTPTPNTPTPKAIEELVPPKLQEELEYNYELLDVLITKGKDEKGTYKTVNYDGDMVSEFITIYFHEKYRQSCPMYPIKTYSYFDTDDFKNLCIQNKRFYTEETLKEHMLKNYKYATIDWDKAEFLENLTLCLERGEQIILIPFRIPTHLNMVIVKAQTREIIRFEPLGSRVYDIQKEEEYNTFLENLTVDVNVHLKLTDNRKFTYVKPNQLCPMYKANPIPNYKTLGFQTMEGLARDIGPGEGGGFCQLWSWFFAECVIKNPEWTVEDVYAKAFHYLETDPNNFATIIRGYFFSINDELKKMNKTFTIEKTEKRKLDGADILLEYLRQSKGRLQTKEQKTFQDGGKKHAFILPNPNPKASPVNLYTHL